MSNHPRRSSKRTLERAKSLLIVLLTCSAIFLASRTQISANLRPAPSPGITAPPTGTVSTASTQPVRLVTTQVDGTHVRHYGVQYADVSELYAGIAPLLAEALTSAEAPHVVDHATWRSALQASGVYFDFLGNIPLDTLAVWLTGGSVPTLPGDAAVRRLVLASQSGTVSLYYRNETDGKAYSCAVSPNLFSRLATLTAAVEGNRAAFAFQLGVAYEELDPNTLILPDPPAPPVYASTNPLGAVNSDKLSPVQSDILRAFSFHLQTSAIYPIPGGVAINEGGDTLRLAADGTLTYQASDLTDVRLPAGAHPVEAARSLAEATIGSLCGSARLYLSSVTPTEHGAVITFEYALSGASVQMDFPAATFTMEDGILVSASLRFRSYAPTGTQTLILPELQAAAAANALESGPGELLLRYEDSGGDTVCAVWSM